MAPLAAGCASEQPERAVERSDVVVRPDRRDGPRPRPDAVDRPEPGPAPPVELASGSRVAPPVSEAPVAAPEPESPPPPPVVNRPPPRPDRSAPEAGSTAPPAAESTAVHPTDFPDPYVLRANGAWWAFSTQVGVTAVPAMRSADLLTWEPVGDALGRAPQWSESGHNWAPAVLPRASGFVLYHTTRHRATGLQCISRAISVLPQGPYADDSDRPFICQMRRGGSIDPSPFVDADGRPWLLWKSEGTLLGEPTRIWVQELSADGLQLRGRPTQLLERALPWEEPIIEGPSMARRDGTYHLFYSGNRWETAGYAVGHAVCESVTGPCRRTSTEPVLRTRPGEAGPGGQEVLHVDGHGPVLVHHAWDPAAVGYPEGARRLHLSELHLDGEVARAGQPWRGRAEADLVSDVTRPRSRSTGTPGGLAGTARGHH